MSLPALSAAAQSLNVVHFSPPVVTSAIFSPIALPLSFFAAIAASATTTVASYDSGP
jgi:hypothetical protein